MRITSRLLGAGVLISGGAYALRCSAHAKSADEHEHAIAQLRKQAEKARQRAQERVRLGQAEVLGMTPKLWLEALDESHRYGSVLYHYWQRWETSRTRWMFFDWLDRGRGSLIDLPTCPRRLLEESSVLYLTREQLKFCEVRIERGRLMWCTDGSPVTLPLPSEGPETETARAAAITALIEERLTTTRARERLLAEARAAVAEAVRSGREATPEALAEVAAPLVRHGLLRQLRDAHWQARGVAMPTIQDEKSYQEMWDSFKAAGQWADGGARLLDAAPAGGGAAANPSAHLVGGRAGGTGRGGEAAYALPEALLPGLGWADVVAALDHEEGRNMGDGRLPTADERRRPGKPGKGGIFAVDQWGGLHAAQKVPGVLHHSSLTGGHCCRFAGALTVRNGLLLKLSPHSGHYVPTQAEYDALLRAWEEEGLDLSHAEIGGLVKEKRP